MKIEIQPFVDKMIPQAAELLARRHVRNRAEFPLLPARFEDARIAANAVSAAWEKKFKYGYAAFRNGEMIAWTRKA